MEPIELENHRIDEPIITNLEDKDKTQVTILPFNSVSETPVELVELLFLQFNKEIEKGDTYPQDKQLSKDEFLNYWFHHFVAVMVTGTYNTREEFVTASNGKDTDYFTDIFLGSFYIKPNYIGRSSHNCNAGFLVNPIKRGMSIGKTLGKNYIKLAPKLNFKYSVFNLVYESNVASCKIWDGLGFERIGKIKNAGYLRNQDKPVDAIMYGYEF